MDKDFIGQLLNESGITLDISQITLARELWEKIPAHRQQVFADTVIRHCLSHCQPLLPKGELTILLINDEGKIYGNCK
jgi:cobalt-precorrin-5B (C1)-methyltransferase